jgi:hypothetical protein
VVKLCECLCAHHKAKKNKSGSTSAGHIFANTRSSQTAK